MLENFQGDSWRSIPPLPHEKYKYGEKNIILLELSPSASNNVSEQFVFCFTHVSPQWHGLSSDAFSLWSSVSGTQAPFPGMNKMFSGDIFPDHAVPFHYSRRSKTLSQDGLVLFFLLPVDTSRASPLNPSHECLWWTPVLLKAQFPG